MYFFERLFRPIDLAQPGEVSGMVLVVLALGLLVAII